MLSTLLSRQPSLNWFGVTKALTPLTLGVVLLTSQGKPAEAQVIFQAPSPTNQIMGSPIPSPVPVVPGTSNPYSLSPYNSNSYPYNTNSYPYNSNSDYNPYGYYDYNQGIITPGRQIIRNSTLINPTVINSRITDSVLVDPVIVDSPGYSRRVFRQPPVIYNPSPYFYNRPGIRIRVGY